MESTFELARTGGAGLQLANRHGQVFKVSDWSPSTRQVYGHRRKPDGSWGEYVQLPETGLRTTGAMMQEALLRVMRQLERGSGLTPACRHAALCALRVSGVDYLSKDVPSIAQLLDA
jgi:hypothetical protein